MKRADSRLVKAPCHTPQAWITDASFPQNRHAGLGLPGRMETMMKLKAFVLFASLGTLASTGAIAQDAAAGEKVFAKCKVCHQIGPTAKNQVGPVLTGVVGRPAGTYPGYTYSEANKTSGITWDEATLAVYLKDPKAKVPGTKMTFPGLSSDDDIKNVIAYLKTFPAPAQ
jgi:cytochrome c